GPRRCRDRLVLLRNVGDRGIFRSDTDFAEQGSRVAAASLRGSSVPAAGRSMPGGLQPLARSVVSTVVLSGRSPAAQASRGCWRGPAVTSRCRRVWAVASADAAPATAPAVAAATAWVPRFDGAGGVGGVD